jgi:hypothetical protein
MNSTYKLDTLTQACTDFNSGDTNKNLEQEYIGNGNKIHANLFASASIYHLHDGIRTTLCKFTNVR